MESNQEGQSSNLQESEGTQEEDDSRIEDAEQEYQEEVVDLASDQEEEAKPETATRGFDVAFGTDFHFGGSGNGGEPSSSMVEGGPPNKKLRTATEGTEVEEITLSSDED